jgi:hypothetical protein
MFIPPIMLHGIGVMGMIPSNYALNMLLNLSIFSFELYLAGPLVLCIYP